MDRNQGKDLLARAAASSANSLHVAHDFGSGLFPKSDIIISDRMLSFGRQYLQGVVADLENQICNIATNEYGVGHPSITAIQASDECHCYPRLRKAGLLESKPVLQHVFVRAQYAEITVRLLQKISREEIENALTRNLDHDDSAIADAAMAMLVAQGRNNSGIANISDLPAEILYSLTWTTVAALEKISDYRGTRLADAAQKLLGQHDESDSANSRARRLALLLDQTDESVGQIPHPLEDGLLLFLARIAHGSGLDIDEIITFTSDPDMERLVVSLKALQTPVNDALSIFAALNASGSILTAATYNEIDAIEAQELVQKWGMNSTYLEAERYLSGEQTGAVDL